MCLCVRPPRSARDLALVGALAIASCERSAPRREAVAPTVSAEPRATLEFRVEGRSVRRVTLEELERAVGVETVRGFDAYYHREKVFRALSLQRVLAVGFAGESGAPLATRQFVLRARDGYTVPIAGERLYEGGAFIAVRDVESPAWEPIGPQRANPSPAYLIWSEPTQTDLETHPRPWQLAVIEATRFEAAFPHTVPTGEAPTSPAMRGFELFARECVRCHAINREGGRVGPDLNVPLSVVEYRPEAQIRAYILDPRTFRYGNMPAHLGLSDGDLDGLIAYLRAMSTRKHDPDARPDGGAAP